MSPARNGQHQMHKPIPEESCHGVYSLAPLARVAPSVFLMKPTISQVHAHEIGRPSRVPVQSAVSRKQKCSKSISCSVDFSGFHSDGDVLHFAFPETLAGQRLDVGPANIAMSIQPEQRDSRPRYGFHMFARVLMNRRGTVSGPCPQQARWQALWPAARSLGGPVKSVTAFLSEYPHLWSCGHWAADSKEGDAGGRDVVHDHIPCASEGKEKAVT